MGSQSLMMDEGGGVGVVGTAVASGTAARPTAEERVLTALRAALPADYRVYPNVRWISKADANAPARDGETDLLLVHPEHGLLVVETKGGRIRRDGQGRWFSNEHRLEPPPFQQAETSKHALARKIASLPDWPGAPRRAGHAVAFPDVDLATLTNRAFGLGPDAPLELILDATALSSPDSTRRAVQRAYDHWVGDGRRGSPLAPRHLELIDELLAPTVELRPLLRRQIEEGEREVVELTRAQMRVLDMLRGMRRAAIVGPAGSGKTMLAAEKARRLAREGFRTLLVCFNQPLARMLTEELAQVHAPGGLDVLTFHEVCLRLGREAGTLTHEPAEKDQEWFDRTLPGALDAAIQVVGGQYHAIIVDEGQDFEKGWLESLFYLLVDPDSDVLYVFHDPSQSLYREDVVATLGLPSFPILDNCRNPKPIHDFAARFYTGEGPIAPLRETGREPEIIEAEPGRPTLEALRRVLHRLVVEEQVPPWWIAVLTGRSLAKSDVWRQRVFGDQVLWNGSYDESGRSLGLPADQALEQPSDTILFDSIRRFKGLEREVVVLVELDPADARLGQLLYVGTSRARQHAVALGPRSLITELTARLGAGLRSPSDSPLTSRTPQGD